MALFISSLLERSPHKTQDAFAEAAGFDQGTMSKWINQKQGITARNLLRLIRASGVLSELAGSPLLHEIEETALLQERVSRLEALVRDRRDAGEET